MMEQPLLQWNTEYDMCSLNGGRTWRSFARHVPSGEVYILEQDNTPGYEANYTQVGGPYHHHDITRTFLPKANLDEDAILWAIEQTWEPVEMPAR